MDIQQKIEQLLEKYKDKLRYAGPKNSIVKHASQLIDNTKPNPRKLFVMEGIWAFNMARKAGIKVINFILAPECVYSPEAYELAKIYCEKAEDLNIVSKKVFMSLSEREEPDGLMAVCQLPQKKLSDISIKNSIILVLDGLEIPGNVGTIIRSADAAAVDAIFICNRKARLTHPKCIKGSMGAIFFKPIIDFENMAECQKWLKDNQFSIYLADTRAEKGYHEYGYFGNTALVMGSERYGIHREWYTGDVNKLSIPMLGQCDSLNVAIATTVILYEMRLKKSGMTR